MNGHMLEFPTNKDVHVFFKANSGDTSEMPHFLFGSTLFAKVLFYKVTHLGVC